MNPDRPAERRRRKARLQPEMLESRSLMTTGAGNTFAIFQTAIATTGQKAVVPFTYQPSLVTLNARHQITLGIDVAPQTGSTVVPRIVAVEDLQTHRMIPMTRANYVRAVQVATPGQGNQSTAVLVTLRMSAAQAQAPHNYAVVVQGQGGSAGPLLVGFYLPGDTTGDGKVDAADIAAIKQGLNVNANNPNYVFASDSNRDGKVNNTDLRSAEQNVGTVVNVSPVVSANLNPSSDSGLQDRITNIQTVTLDGTATPGAKITYTDTDNTAPPATTTASVAGTYAVQVKLGPGQNTFAVSSTDPFGQTISGSIAPVTFSATAPTAPTPVAPKTATSTTTGGASPGSTTPTGMG